MYTMHNNQKPWTNAQAGEYGVVTRASHKVAVTYKKSKLNKVQQAQANAALAQLKQAAVAKKPKCLALAGR